MFIFCAVQDDMAFEFDPVSESSDEIEPQSEMRGFPDMGGEEDGAGAPDSGQTGLGGEAGDKPPEVPGKSPQAPKKEHDSYPFYRIASDNLDVNGDNHDPSNGCFVLRYLLVERIEYRLKPLERKAIISFT